MQKRKDSPKPSRFAATLPPQFGITNISTDAGQVAIGWQSGVAPFQIEGSQSLAGPWTAATNVTISSSQVLPAATNAFWRIRSQVPIFFLNTNDQPRLSWLVPEIMSDTLQNYILQRRQTPIPDGQAISDDTGWETIATPTPTAPGSTMTFQDPTPAPVSWRLKEPTVGGQLVPYGTKTLTDSPAGSIQLLRAFGGKSGVSLAGIIPSKVLVDSSKNVIVIGKMTYTAETGKDGSGNDTQLISAGSYDAIIAKYSPDGVCLWAKRYGGVSSDYFLGGCLDSSGNIYAIGSVFGGSAGSQDFGFGSESNYGDSDVLLVKFDPSGNALWHKIFGGTGSDGGAAVAVDPNDADKVFICGTYGFGFFPGGINFGGGELPAPVYPGKNGFIARLHGSNGSYNGWQRALGVDNETICVDLAVGSDGHPVLAAKFHVVSDFGGGHITSTGGYDSVTVKYNGATGDLLWLNQMTGSSDAQVQALALDSANRVYCVGTFTGTVTWYPGQSDTLDQNEYNRIFCIQYLSTGAWGKKIVSIGNTGSETAVFAVTVDSNNAVIIVGSMIVGMDFGEGYLLGDDKDVLLLKYKSDGSLSWSRRGAYGGDDGLSVAMGSNNQIILAGSSSQSGLAGLRRIASGAIVVDPPKSMIKEANVTATAYWATISP